MLSPKTFPYILCLVFLGIIFLQRCNTHPVENTLKPKIDTVVRIDTFYIHDTLYGKPVLVQSKPQIQWRDTGSYKPDTNYAKLLKQYDELGDKFFSRNVYKTPYSLGVYGDATVTDTVVSNKLTGNSIAYNIKIPIVTNTITIDRPYKPKAQVYVGFGVTMNKIDLIRSADLGVIYKNKKDQLFQLRVEQPFNGSPISYSVGSYWKIKF